MRRQSITASSQPGRSTSNQVFGAATDTCLACGGAKIVRHLDANAVRSEAARLRLCRAESFSAPSRLNRRIPVVDSDSRLRRADVATGEGVGRGAGHVVVPGAVAQLGSAGGVGHQLLSGHCFRCCGRCPSEAAGDRRCRCHHRLLPQYRLGVVAATSTTASDRQICNEQTAALQHYCPPSCVLLHLRPRRQFLTRRRHGVQCRRATASVGRRPTEGSVGSPLKRSLQHQLTNRLPILYTALAVG
jgi:hypothetical protein